MDHFINNPLARRARVSVRSGREREGDGRHATAVPCDTATSFSLTSFFHLLQSFETLYPIDAGSTVACLLHGQERDSLKPPLVHHEEGFLADLCLGRHSSCASSDDDRPTWEKRHKRWTRCFFLNARNSDGRMYVTSKMRMNDATKEMFEKGKLCFHSFSNRCWQTSVAPRKIPGPRSAE